MNTASQAKSLYVHTRARFLLLNAIFVIAINVLVFFSMSLLSDSANLLSKIREISQIQKVANYHQASAFKLNYAEKETQNLRDIQSLSAYKELQSIMQAKSSNEVLRDSFNKGEQWILNGGDPAASDEAKSWIYQTTTRMQALQLVTALSMSKKMEATFFCYIMIAFLMGIWGSLIYHRYQLKRAMQPVNTVPRAVSQTASAIGK